MQSEEFLGLVKTRAHCESSDAAMRATQATLATLAERLTGNEPENLASQLPGDIAQHLHPEGEGQGSRFSVDEFISRVADREGVPRVEAAQHAQVVMGVMSEAVTSGEIGDVKAQLPDDYGLLFEQTWH